MLLLALLRTVSLSIEGLAPTPDGSLLLGFRNPIPNGRALTARLHNAPDLIQGRADAAVLTLAGRLDLGGRGIRALECLPAGRGYVLIAGAFDDSRDFRVYHWSGGADRPVAIDIPALNELNPEKLLAMPLGGRDFELELFSDDGDLMVGDKKCKKLANEHARSFRSRKVVVTIGGA